METDAYMNEDLLYKDPRYMNEKEKKKYAILKENEKRYKKYAPLESICKYCFWSRERHLKRAVYIYSKTQIAAAQQIAYSGWQIKQNQQRKSGDKKELR